MMMLASLSIIYLFIYSMIIVSSRFVVIEAVARGRLLKR